MDELDESTHDPETFRERLVERARHRLERFGEPRTMMTVILLAAGLAAFIASVAMLHAGVVSMAWRYPLATAVGYVVFLALLGCWLRGQSADAATAVLAVTAAELEAAKNPAEPPPPPPSPPSPPSPPATAEVESPPWPRRRRTPSNVSFNLSGGSGGSGGGGGNDAGFVLALIALAVIVSLIVAVVLVLTSPGLFAELLVDGVVLAGLPKRFNQPPGPHWLATALWKTCFPAGAIAAVFTFVGMGLDSVVPPAHTMGGVLHNVMTR